MGAVLSEAEFRPVVGSFACQVQWGDCDPAGIIFYPTYFRWMDAACWALFASVGYDAKRMRAEHLAMPLVCADCQFLYPAEQGDRCEVRSSIVRFGGKSFVVAHEVQRADGMALAKGTETRVWGKYEAGPGTRLRGVAMPEDLKARFRAT
ncbi:MAG TPA: acyl-CoA thioesterase [Burkholderiales bacterium]|nr:acyl-CoA thioesterase [Burkholderiales bacterium]